MCKQRFFEAVSCPEKYYNLKGLLKSRDLRGVGAAGTKNPPPERFLFLKKMLDMPQSSTYKYTSESRDSKHYYTSKLFPFPFYERAVHTSVSRLFHFFDIASVLFQNVK